MMEEDEITPEHIVEQSKVLTDAELLELIKKFSVQEYNSGFDAGHYDY